MARDLHAVLAKVQQGVEVVIEQDHRPIAVLKSSMPARPSRKLNECIALAKATKPSSASRRDSFEPPGWD